MSSTLRNFSAIGDTSLRTPDALHLAICRRLGAELLTFDQGMIAAARSLGVSIAAV